MALSIRCECGATIGLAYHEFVAHWHCGDPVVAQTRSMLGTLRAKLYHLKPRDWRQRGGKQV